MVKSLAMALALWFNYRQRGSRGGRFVRKKTMLPSPKLTIQKGAAVGEKLLDKACSEW